MLPKVLHTVHPTRIGAVAMEGASSSTVKLLHETSTSADNIKTQCERQSAVCGLLLCALETCLFREQVFAMT